MIKIGLVSAATYGYLDAPRTPGSFHGTAFASAFNGFDPAKKEQYEWTFATASKRMEGTEVVKVWDPQREWAERLATLGQPVTVSTAGAVFEGVAAGVNADGALLVRLDNGRLETVMAGDVTLRTRGRSTHT